jgi:hypothetical protein
MPRWSAAEQAGSRRSSRWAPCLLVRLPPGSREHSEPVSGPMRSSLAMATGHGLEYPAAEAIRALCDYVEPPGSVTAGTLAAYMELGDPRAGSNRVLRAVLHSDSSPPLYYLLLNLWRRLFGTTDLALRTFSIGCMLLCVPFLARLGMRVGGYIVALLIVAMFVAAPGVAVYAIDAQMYALLCLVSVALLKTTLDWDDGARAWRSLEWVLAGHRRPLTHYFVVFPIAASTAWLLRTPGSRRRTLAACAVVAALVAPWYVYVPWSLRQRRITTGWLDGDAHRPTHWPHSGPGLPGSSVPTSPGTRHLGCPGACSHLRRWALLWYWRLPAGACLRQCVFARRSSGERLRLYEPRVRRARHVATECVCILDVDYQPATLHQCHGALRRFVGRSDKHVLDHIIVSG